MTQMERDWHDELSLGGLSFSFCWPLSCWEMIVCREIKQLLERILNEITIAWKTARDLPSFKEVLLL